MTAGKSDLIDISGILRHETDRAYLVDAGGKTPVWLPKSQVEYEPGDTPMKPGTFTMPEWLALERGLI